MTVDQRLFAYPLEPQLQRLRWRLDEQLAALASAQSAIEPLLARSDALAGESADVARDLAQGQIRRIDPVHARRALDYLADLHRRHASAQREHAEAERLVGEHRDGVAATQVEIDRLERDREECLAEHRRELDRREQRETDQDWTARAAWRALVAPQEVLP